MGITNIHYYILAYQSNLKSYCNSQRDFFEEDAWFQLMQFTISVLIIVSEGIKQVANKL